MTGGLERVDLAMVNGHVGKRCLGGEQGQGGGLGQMGFDEAV